MRVFVPGWWPRVLLLALIVPAVAQEPRVSSPPVSGSNSAGDSATAAPVSAPDSFEEVIDRVVDREHQLQAQLHNLHPMIETYLQNLKPDATGNGSPVNDQYFLGRLDMTEGPGDISFADQPGS